MAEVGKELEWEGIRRRAGLVSYKAPPPSVLKKLAERRELGIPRRERQYLKVGKTDIGSYSIHSRVSKESCHIRVVENLPEDKRHIVGVWTGDAELCEPKKREVAGVIHRIRAQQRSFPIRLLPEPKKGGEPEQYIVSVGRSSVTKKPVPIQTARDVAKSISSVKFEDISIRDSQGQVEETYKRGARTYTRSPHRPPPIGRQFYTPTPERSPQIIRAELLGAAKRGDREAVIELTKELGSPK